jgi:tetratricopeptide (TPR) repeat protein
VTHLSAEELSIYSIDRALLDDPDAAQKHLSDCGSCRAEVELNRRFDESLRSSEPWRVADPASDSHRKSLHAMARQTQEEDKEAEQLLAPLLASPDRGLWAELANDTRYRTGGIVRKLSAAANQLNAQTPTEALAISSAALAISMELPDDLYPARAVFALRGLAWKEQSNALRFLDRFREGLEALSRAEECFAGLDAPDFDLAIIEFNRASVLFERDDLYAAEGAAGRSSALFRHFGQEARERSVGVVQGAVLWRRGDFAGAIEAFQQVLSSPEIKNDTSWVAGSGIRSNLAWCHLDAGDPLTAAELFREGRVGLMKLGYASDVTRCDWGLALISRDLGNQREALAQLLAVSAAFAEQQVVVDSATAMVEAFEIMLALGETADIERLAAGLVETLTEAGKMESALTALAYIREAAAGKSITPEILRAARTFLRRADRHPDLVFAPPPVF